MSINVMELQPGDRVVLNCPKARGEPKREAQFEGVFRTLAEARARDGCAAVLISQPSIEFLATRKAWARFLMQTISCDQGATYPGGGAIPLPPFNGTADVVAAFIVEADGGLREEEGRRVFIERRMRMGHG